MAEIGYCFSSILLLVLYPIQNAPNMFMSWCRISKPHSASLRNHCLLMMSGMQALYSYASYELSDVPISLFKIHVKWNDLIASFKEPNGLQLTR